jgi:tRNA(Ile)-lysidine synthase TilS/MesJ
MPEIKICRKCILPETFPGIKFDGQGVCIYCLKEEPILAKAHEKKATYRNTFDLLIKDIKGIAPSYDAIMAYSGGKDSTYTLKLLKERYDLRLIALTFDNHFVSPAAWENIEKVTDTLQIDHIRFRLPWPAAQNMFSLTARKDIFSKPTLFRASSVCTACIGLVKSLVLKTALEMSIPLVAFGWSPGQAPIQSAIMKTNPALTRQTQSALKKAFPGETCGFLENYFIPDGYYEIYKERYPQNIHPLAFFDYNEARIIEELNDIGWRAPTDTDTNSSNCLLNAFANQIHIERNGFHPYVWEIANMVRQGVMDRDEGMEKIYTEQNPQMVEYAKKRLGL